MMKYRENINKLIQEPLMLEGTLKMKSTIYVPITIIKEGQVVNICLQRYQISLFILT